MKQGFFDTTVSFYNSKISNYVKKVLLAYVYERPVIVKLTGPLLKTESFDYKNNFKDFTALNKHFV